MEISILIFVFLLLLFVNNRIWRLLETTREHNIKTEALLIEIRDSLKATQ